MGQYVDMTAVVQVIGNIYLNPGLLEVEDKYFFTEEDFTEEFHKILFGSIYNLHALGSDKISIENIEDYLSQRPKKYGIYKANKGAEYLLKISETIRPSAFEYYYNRMKKMTLFRMYQNIGLDVSWLYDIDNILDIKKKQYQEDWLDNTPLEEIANLIDDKISEIRYKYVDDSTSNSVQAGDSMLSLLERLKETPELGAPLYGPLVNTVTKGARLKKFYLRSAATGVGKSRSMIADACYLACQEIFNLQTVAWERVGVGQPTVYITTEQEVEEVQTMMLAFVSAVNEEHIIGGTYEEGEWERVLKAADILSKAPLYIERLPDFSLKDIENTIKKNVREFDCKYVFNSNRV